MNSKWFTNRGQMLQAAIAVVAATASLMIWFAIPPASILYLAPIGFMACFFWICFLFGRWAGSRKIAVPLPSPDPGAEITLVDIMCDLGNFWQGSIQGRTFRIVLHSLSQIENKNAYQADIEVAEGVGPLEGGNKTTQVGPVRFWLPTSNNYHPEASSIFLFDVLGTDRVRIVTLRVSHINFYAKNATMVICVVEGRAERVTHTTPTRAA
jgi:hypothetical protein